MVKVLMVNRPDIYEKKGGDYIQMMGTKKYLERLGVEVIITNNLPSENHKYNVDVIHIFNLQTAEFTYKWVKFGKENNIPTVVSPIYWKSNPFNFKTIFDLNFYRSDKWIWKNFIRSKFHFLEKYSSKFKIQKKILLLCDYVLPNSLIELKHLEEKFSLNLSHKSEIVYNGIDTELFQLSNLDKKENIIIQVGTISPTKNQATTIKATIDFNIDLFFIGRVEDEEYLKYCKNLSNYRKGKTYFLPELPQENLIEFYKKAKIHILPSWRETPGLSNLEAAYMGCHIITTTEGSAKEYFGRKAWYCKPFDISSIKKSILSALDMKNELLLSDFFTWENSAKKTLECYKKIIRK